MKTYLNLNYDDDGGDCDDLFVHSSQNNHSVFESKYEIKLKCFKRVSETLIIGWPAK